MCFLSHRTFLVLTFLVACGEQEKDTGLDVDADLDGWVATEDCDDTDAEVNPGSEEVCDGVDNDCDEAVDEGVLTTFYADADGDGYGTEDDTDAACAEPDGYTSLAGDCDDDRSDVNPEAAEICDEVDNDCDGTVDEGVTSTWYADTDGDGWGTPDDTTETCHAPSGYVSNDEDCDDTDAEVMPGATEYCNGEDDDCDDAVDEDAADGYTLFRDADGDGYGDDDTTTTACEDRSGYATVGDDCDDDDSFVNPAATEVCDEVDNDCDGLVDDDAVDAGTWYEDADGDGYGDSDSTVEACDWPSGYALRGDDCDDDDFSVNPGATEVCDDVDNDCSGLVDDDAVDADTWYEDADGDGYGDPDSSAEACDPPSGYVLDNTDCNDADSDVYPGAGCWTPAYFYTEYGFGIEDGAPADVTYDGDTYSPYMTIVLADEEYLDDYDEDLLCTLYYDIELTDGYSDSSAAYDFEVTSATYSESEGELCEDLDTTLFGSDPYTYFEDAWVYEITVEEMDSTTESVLSGSYGVYWSDYEDYVVAGEWYLDGTESAGGAQTHYGMPYAVDSSMEITGDALESLSLLIDGEDAYVELSSMYLWYLE